MRQKSRISKDAADKLVRGIKRKARKQYSAEEKIRIVLAGLRDEESIAALCRREGIAESLYYSWSKEFLEAVINEAQSSGGFPRTSILAKTVYGSVLLPEERSVDWSLTHA